MLCGVVLADYYSPIEWQLLTWPSALVIFIMQLTDHYAPCICLTLPNMALSKHNLCWQPSAQYSACIHSLVIALMCTPSRALLPRNYRLLHLAGHHCYIHGGTPPRTLLPHNSRLLHLAGHHCYIHGGTPSRALLPHNYRVLHLAGHHWYLQGGTPPRALLPHRGHFTSLGITSTYRILHLSRHHSYIQVFHLSRHHSYIQGTSPL